VDRVADRVALPDGAVPVIAAVRDASRATLSRVTGSRTAT
jgi:hypothetical protein